LELVPLVGQPIFDSIRTELSRSDYDYKVRIARLNELGFETALTCIQKWGGPKANHRLKSLKLLPVHCETLGNDVTELYYERSSKPKILVYPGSPEKLLQDCVLLEFSFFHEYISHAFPNWKSDEDRLSEGWLLALEIEWFREEFTFSDRQTLVESWLPRLGEDKRDFHVAHWLLARCEDKVCAKKFILEWVADWTSNAQGDNDDLLSLITGVMKKAGFRLGGKQSKKDAATRQLLDEQICGPCADSSWKINKIRDILETEMELYDTPKTT
jgi:hypothetical protein